jgi:hypothetical protein
MLQIRTRVLNEDWEDTFLGWYPDFRPNWKTRSSKRLDPLDSNALCNNCGYFLHKHDGREGYRDV